MLLLLPLNHCATRGLSQKTGRSDLPKSLLLGKKEKEQRTELNRTGWVSTNLRRTLWHKRPGQLLSHRLWGHGEGTAQEEGLWLLPRTRLERLEKAQRQWLLSTARLPLSPQGQLCREGAA